MMAEETEITLEDIVARKNEAYNAVTFFEVARRRVYMHCRIVLPTEEGPITRTSTRQTELWYALLTGSCEHCHARHTCLSQKSYLEWYAQLPFRCDHGGAITDMQIEPDERTALEYPHVYMPSQLRRMEPDGITVSSGGPTTLDKLRRDSVRLQATYSNALNLLADLLNFSRHHQVDRIRHPEMATIEVRNLMGRIAHEHEEAAVVVRTQILAL